MSAPRFIRTSSCHGCPFAHRQADDPSSFCCVLESHQPAVTQAVAQRRRYAGCQLAGRPFVGVVAGAAPVHRDRRGRLRSKKVLFSHRNRPTAHAN